MSSFTPLGPPSPKKPKPKVVKFMDDLYGYISCGDTLTNDTELYAWNEDANDLLLVRTGTYTTETNVTIEVVDGIIQ